MNNIINIETLNNSIVNGDINLVMAELLESEVVTREFNSEEELNDNMDDMIDQFNAAPFAVCMKQVGGSICFSAELFGEEVLLAKYNIFAAGGKRTATLYTKRLMEAALQTAFTAN